MTGATKDKRKRHAVWMASGAVLLGIAVIAGAAMLFGDDEQPASPASAGEGAIDATPAQDVPQVVTPPAVGDRSEADEYRAAVVAVNGEIAEQLDALTRQLVVPSYGDPVWLADTRSVLARMSITAAKARSIEAPTAFEPAHTVWLEGVDACTWAADNLTVAIEGPDEALIGQCNDRLVTASYRFQEATRLMQQATAE